MQGYLIIFKRIKFLLWGSSCRTTTTTTNISTITIAALIANIITTIMMLIFFFSSFFLRYFLFLHSSYLYFSVSSFPCYFDQFQLKTIFASSNFKFVIICV
jgi:flagellar biosynthesis protein FliR